ncbi:hypothetical protein [Chengkuizengella axinellae]|uniref:Uncharacterized protein n=1 Tax=Chengkuizengella axinellae TaxID=3064388 RepID=A0ABT9IWZ1_9BACL|nr:hypothetical protein [Chengkuizengella sp. 2205SS18-9]MDP5273878.1 hypothetical protein [Chengkuizengella sp. 2205SS18-9]
MIRNNKRIIFKLSKEPTYNGRSLEIGVVGDKVFPAFDRITYTRVELDSLVPEESQFDAIFITEDAFLQADNVKYVPFFNQVLYPIYFIGMEDHMSFAFTFEEITLDMAKNENSAYIQGIKNEADGTRKNWGVYREHSETMKELLLILFNDPFLH